MARITANGVISEAFAVTNAVEQGCVPAPPLFGLIFTSTLIDAYRDERPGIGIAFRTNGHILNSRCMQAIMQLTTTTVCDLLFSDDCALNTTTEVDMQWSLDPFTGESVNFNLKINTNETVIMHQPSPNAECNSPQITVNGNQLQTVDKSAHLGSKLSRNTNIDDEVARRLSKARPLVGLKFPCGIVTAFN
nr:unnamed protein product [Spirometra erinaceieuropaei]